MVCYPGINRSLGYWRNCHWFLWKIKGSVSQILFWYTDVHWKWPYKTCLVFFYYTHCYEHSTFANLAQFASLFPLTDKAKVGYRAIATAEIINVILLQREKNASRVSLVFVFSPGHPLIQWLALLSWYISFISHSLIAFNSTYSRIVNF